VPKPLKVEFSPTALFDLEDIADYIAKDNPIAAEQWVEKLVAAAERVAGHPRSGRAVPTG
jgi:toxin ParE1/3/4